MNVGIIGASGYVGLELLRLLALHPQFKVTWITSREHQGKAVSSVHTALHGVYDIPFADRSTLPPNLDIVFLAVPHGESMRIAAELRAQAPQLKIIDLGSDFRLDAATYEATYHHPHTAPALLETAVYGTPEICPERIAQSALIANPGCFAHCIILALTPLARAGLIEGRVNIAAVTGSSGSGALATPKTHHPERNDSLSAYQVLKHRHVPEIEGALSQWGKAIEIDFVPISGPLSRGIFATSFVTLTEPTADIGALYAEFAEMNPFIRIREETPRTLEVRGSNFVDISVHRAGSTAVIVSTLDNLVKGAGGNAIQSANLMSGLPPTTGLLSPPLFP
jgi:N-acetyl-gamma-glutamyl-phosphate reductase